MLKITGSSNVASQSSGNDQVVAATSLSTSQLASGGGHAVLDETNIATASSSPSMTTSSPGATKLEKKEKKKSEKGKKKSSQSPSKSEEGKEKPRKSGRHNQHQAAPTSQQPDPFEKGNLFY